MKTQILSLNLGMNLLDTIIKASKFVFLEVGLNATKLDNIFFQYHLYCFKFGRQFDSDVSNNPRNFCRISKEFYCSWNFLSEALSKTQFGWSQSSKILRLCKILTKGCIILLDVTVLYMYKSKMNFKVKHQKSRPYRDSVNVKKKGVEACT